MLRKQFHFPSKEIKELKFNAQNLYSESCKKTYGKNLKNYINKVTHVQRSEEKWQYILMIYKLNKFIIKNSCWLLGKTKQVNPK